MGNWRIVVPEATTNYVLNPSAETSGNYAAHNSATISLDTAQARQGDYCYLVTTGGTNRGINLTLASLAAADHAVTFYCYGTITGTLQCSTNAGANYNDAAIVGGSTGGWVRYYANIPSAQASGSAALIIRNTANENFRLDAIQIEAKTAYYTTYIDGDQPGGRWSGLRHASTSTRDVAYRSGGRVRDLDTDYGVRVLQVPGFGVPPIINHTRELALQPGAVHQGYKVGVRQLVLQFDLHATTLAGLHGRRQDLIDLIKPDAVRNAQPVTIVYTGANAGRSVWGEFYYGGGLEGTTITGGGNWIEGSGSPVNVPVTLLGTDPYWREDDRQTATLDYQDTLTSAYAARRVSKQWVAMGSGFNGAVNAIVVDRIRNRVYYGGAFTTGNAVTVNRITYWNGTTFVAMDSGVNGAVYALALAPNGDLYVAGAFTTCGAAASACKGLARWNVSAGTWSALNPGTATFTSVNTVAAVYTYSAFGVPLTRVYVGGVFTDWGGAGAADYIASSDDNGSTWSGVGTSPFTSTDYPSRGRAMVVAPNGSLYVGSDGTTTSALRAWNGSAWSTVAAADNLGSPSFVRALCFDKSGNLYFMGRWFTLNSVYVSNLAYYNGTGIISAAALVAAVASGPYQIDIDSGGNLYVPMARPSLADPVYWGAGNYHLIWNGSRFFPADIYDVTEYAPCIEIADDDTVYLGVDTSYTWPVAGMTTVTNNGTADCGVEITIIGPSSDYCYVNRVENITGAVKLDFAFAMGSGETVSVSTLPQARKVSSTLGRDLSSQPLSSSDYTSFVLLPGSNTIGALIAGTVTGVVCLMHWTPRHWAIDGPA